MKVPQELYEEILVLTDFPTAVAMGNKFAISRLFDRKTHDWDWAVTNGHLNVVKWLQVNRVMRRYRRFRCTERTMYLAVRSGHLDVVRWM